MRRRGSRGFLGRMAVALSSSLILVAAGLAFILVPLEVGHRSCGGNAFTVRLQQESPARHSQECHSEALAILIFGSAVTAAGAGLLGFSTVLLRRPV